MILENQWRIDPKPIIPKRLKNHVKIFSNCKLSKQEVILFNISLQSVANYLEHDSIDLSDYHTLNIVFTENGKISFHDTKDNVNGMQIYMAIYKMMQLRKKGSSSFSLFVFIEELVHYFWRISDETIVKYKVTEIMQTIVADFTIEIAKGWGLYGL